MLLKKFIKGMFGDGSRMGVSVVVTVLSLSLAVNCFAQENDKGDDANSKAERQKYLMELAKYWSFGWENYKNKQYRDAIKHFWKVTKIDTIDKFPKVYRYLGDSYFKLQDPDSAQYVYELGLKEHPEDVHLHRMVGFFQTQRGQIEDAISHYETVVELEPESERDWMQLASLYVKVERIEDAISAYDRVLELDPDNLEAQNNKTALIASTGDIEKVIQEREKIRQKDPQNSQVRFELGKMYFEQGNYEKAIERFNEFLELSPGDIGALQYVGTSYQRLEQYRDAIEIFRKIIEIEPENKRILAEISRSYKELGQFRTARVYANKALAVDRDFGLGWIALGEVYEAAAENCVEAKGGDVDFNDKLVYELADQKYRKAAQDLEFRTEAKRHRDYLKPVLPTKEDKFMHKGQTKAEGECYNWIY
ncbi:tetratricopeptide repeat protein [candidate division KSB1 bacterium]|nr:tetratricopeptide repeat protein [candidate division KSB1 bacterium]NIR70208.1 tetratricopeptide repeat protein [candidate division KSB1 bacterium]NIS26479.1 tetratricopeptide repeat protein [candidate division KSB1 bacterium]NIT73241.1 tetratricopeptide repeat protein [candidate division KSB1 bacterium]NIU23865.1 tetratricopeptide repeat protein [candidate division KSB1 bacterium]